MPYAELQNHYNYCTCKCIYACLYRVLGNGLVRVQGHDLGKNLVHWDIYVKKMMIIRVRKIKHTSSISQVKLFKKMFCSLSFSADLLVPLSVQHSVLQNSVWFYQFSCVNFNHLLSCFAFYHYSLSWREADAFFSGSNTKLWISFLETTFY